MSARRPASLSRRSFVLASGAALLAACDRRGGRPGADRPLVVVLSPAHAPRSPDALRAAIERASGLRVDLRVAASADEALTAVETHRADAGLLPLFDYLFCSEVLAVDPLVQVLRQGNTATYEGDLVVKADSPVADLASLRGQSIGFVDRYSVTGFLLPAKLLRDAGVEIKPVWLGSHDAALTALAEGRVSAAATYKGHVDGKAPFRVLGRTPPIANEPLFVQSSLPADIKSSLRRALTGLTPASLEGVAGAVGFREADPKVYEAALATVRTAGQAVFDLVPGGWVRANERRRPLWSYAP